jgi:hypothetical protein
MKFYNIFKSVVFFSIFLLSSCGIRKNYDSCDDLIESVKGEEYDILVKEWGEPDHKSDYYNNGDASIDGLDLRIDATWSSSKVNVKNQKEITLYFDVVLTGFGEYPHRVILIKNCN